jgi:stage V sporulation protein G
MEITQVKVFPVEEERLKAYVSIVLDDCFLVSDLKVIQGPNGVFVSMPSKRKKNGEFKDIAHPLNRETRERMERRILSEYERIRTETPPSRAEERIADVAEEDVIPRERSEAPAPRESGVEVEAIEEPEAAAAQEAAR